MENIDKIIYINLDHRTDRNFEMLNVFKTYNFPHDKIIRFSAIKHDRGIAGCAKSHIGVIKMILQNGWSNVMIFEDDFEFNYEPCQFEQILTDFFKTYGTKYKLFQLTWGNSKDIKQIKKTNYYKCGRGGGAAGYIINKSFCEAYLNNLEEGLQKLLESNEPPGVNNYSPYNIDMYFGILQQQTLFWITYLPSIGYQRDSYSDIDSQKNKDINRIKKKCENTNLIEN
jgi:glycosyl transferase family 25